MPATLGRADDNLKHQAGPYVGNGTATSFDFDFKVFTDHDVQVILADMSDWNAVTLTLGSDYWVTLNADQNGVVRSCHQHLPN